MNGRKATSRLLSNGLVALGAGFAGGGVYSAVLYHMPFALALACFVGGLAIIGLGRFLGDTTCKQQRNQRPH